MTEKVITASRRPDAGTRSIDHYKSRLPKWRYQMRSSLVSVVRAETPVLARLQARIRTPTLDVFFAWTANLGTHTFFMVMIPVSYWCGQATFGRALTTMLASGVFWSGYVKDLLCLPRPMSPPLQRISKSHSAALEYGFPSTHSTNAVSVALYSIYALYDKPDAYSPLVFTAMQALALLYVSSILFGRIYCGMHGFFDVVVGSLIGLLIAVVQCVAGTAFDRWSTTGSILNPLVASLITLVLVRVHPEPADDCPCYDDSVAFSGVFIGIQMSCWIFERSGFAASYSVPATIPFDFAKLGLVKSFARILLGVLLIFLWREVAKPSLLRLLPPVFRAVERVGLLFPRRFFLSVSEYESVPTLRKDDNVIPSASEIPRMLKSLRHPRQRTISIGPQSEADAYEAIAYRERKRRESRESITPPRSPMFNKSLEIGDNYLSTYRSRESNSGPIKTSALESQALTLQEQLRKELQATPSMHTEIAVTPGVESMIEPFPPFGEISEAEDEKADAEMFLSLLKPRVRYDVEVVTKLIVYAGISVLVMLVAPITFHYVGLGVPN